MKLSTCSTSSTRGITWCFLALLVGLCAAQPGWAATIKVKKVFSPSGDNGHFNLLIKNSSGATVASLANAGNNGMLGPVTVTAGTYVISETAGFGSVAADYTSAISGAGCAANGTVTVTATSNVVCTITNTRKPAGHVTVKKVVVPSGDPGHFTLQLKNSVGTLIANFLNASGGATMGPVSVTSGSTYNVSEVAGTSTNLANYTAVITGTGCAPNGNVNVTAGANIVCTITNTHVPPPCTGYPLHADVNIFNPGTPFGPQTVNICRGGTVTFHNVNSGQAQTIQYVSGPISFPAISLAITNGSAGTTIPLSTAGNEEYKIVGFVVHGHIIVH